MKKFFKRFRRDKCKMIRLGRRGRYVYAMPLDSAGIYEIYNDCNRAA